MTEEERIFRVEMVLSEVHRSLQHRELILSDFREQLILILHVQIILLDLILLLIQQWKLLIR